MKRLCYPLLALFLAFSVHAPAKDPGQTAPYLQASDVDLKALLPNPPADGSPQTLQEIDLILKDQATRTPEEVARIRVEASHLNVFLFKNVIGPWFEEKELPVTDSLFHNVDASAGSIYEAGKKLWGRPRPFLQDKRIHPPISLPRNFSYPSGHSTESYLNALILSQMVPDLKDQILARGRQIGDDRVLAGVHFPSDVEAGRTLAQDLFSKLMANPAFQSDLARAKAEVASVRGK
jgi:acid phosphatase (class A)